jgi:hypothetical protein
MNNFLKVLFCYSDLPKGDQNVWIDQFEHYMAFLLFRRGIKITKNALFLNPNNHTKPNTNNFNPDVLLMVLINEDGLPFFNQCAQHFEEEFKDATPLFVSTCHRSFEDERFFQIDTFEKTFEGSKEGLATLLDLVKAVIQEPTQELVLSEMIGQGYGDRAHGLLADLKRSLKFSDHNLTVLNEQDFPFLKQYVTSEAFPVVVYVLSGIDFTDNEREEILEMLQFGGELALEQPTMSRFLWYEVDFLKTEENLLMLDAIKRDFVMIKGLNIIRSPFEELKEEINTRFIDSRLEQLVTEQRSVVYLINDRASEEVANFKKELEQQGLNIVQLKEGDSDLQLLKDHRFYLTIADSVIIYQEEKNDPWLNIKLVDLFKAPGFGRKKPFSLKLSLLSHKSKIKKGVHLNGVIILQKDTLNYDELLLEALKTITIDV